MEITGHPLPVYYDSRSLVPMFTRSGLAVRSCLYTEVDQGQSGSAIRDDRWKVINFSSGQQRFFDLESDPWETTNLLIGGLTAEEQIAFDALITGCDLTTGALGANRPEQLTAFPNPVSNSLTVQGAGGALVNVEVLDVVGTRVRALRTSDVISLDGLANGVYSVYIEQDDRRSVIRVVKE